MGFRSKIIDYSRGDNLRRFWRLYRLQKNAKGRLLRDIFTFMMSRSAHRHGGYIGPGAEFERCEDFERILEIFQMQNLSVTAVFTHLCTADSNDVEHRAFALRQLSYFQTVLRQLRQRGYSPRAHILGSYGLLNYPEFGGDYARVGIALYGVLSCRDDLTGCPVKLMPVLSLKARVALVKQIYPGEGAGYGLDYVADREKRVAVVSIGYADGIPRNLSGGRGKVLINGFEAPIIGRICMDQMLVDASDVPNAKSGDTAILIGVSGDKEITAYDLAEAADTITNEVLSRLGGRLNRTY